MILKELFREREGFFVQKLEFLPFEDTEFISPALTVTMKKKVDVVTSKPARKNIVKFHYVSKRSSTKNNKFPDYIYLIEMYNAKNF